VKGDNGASLPRAISGGIYEKAFFFQGPGTASVKKAPGGRYGKSITVKNEKKISDFLYISVHDAGRRQVREKRAAATRIE
jgi:hypothetical protein